MSQWMFIRARISGVTPSGSARFRSALRAHELARAVDTTFAGRIQQSREAAVLHVFRAPFGRHASLPIAHRRAQVDLARHGRAAVGPSAAGFARPPTSERSGRPTARARSGSRRCAEQDAGRIHVSRSGDHHQGGLSLRVGGFDVRAPACSRSSIIRRIADFSGRGHGRGSVVIHGTCIRAGAIKSRASSASTRALPSAGRSCRRRRAGARRRAP